MVHGSIGATVRGALLASTALLGLPAVAHAQNVSGPPSGMYNEAQGGGVTSVAPPASIVPSGIYTDPQVVIAQPGTPTTALNNGVNGVGQMVIDQRNGFLGLCSGTLINPRTVLFAAHCVNENAAGDGVQDPWGYGAAQGGIPIAFGFLANNNVAGNSALGKWLSGAQKYQSSTGNFLYNVNQILYNPDSVKLGYQNNFLQGDVAIASLDTPAANVPTWAILLSALPAPSSINAASGTGYHVAEYGYGNNGTGAAGSTGGIDFRRRAAENYVGLLGSLDDVDLFLFGARDGLPQNLYQLDFDDPRRGTATASRFDFNVFKDNALPSEGITAPGDSGGPLVLDRAFAKQVVIGVLSGGSRYFNAQPAGSYGTSSFYQPLYLFWDYIAANNPYRYASAVAGDGAWTDPTHWVTNADPAYQILSGGQLVNGVPTSLGQGINGTTGKFGQICFEQGGSSDCYDNATGVETVNGTPVDATVPATDAATAKAEGDAAAVSAPTAGAADRELVSIHEAQNGKAVVSSLGLTGGDASAAVVGQVAAGGDATATALPPATLVNGLPGATNFVPNNIDPDAATKRNARYFDVKLSAAGTTTLSSAVTIDNFSITASGAKLTVANGGSLTSLMGVNQYTGVVQVDGTLTSRGDYLLLTGGLMGSGRINAPYLTSAVGMIAPGTIGTVGTLTVGGNLVLSSGNTLLIDLGPTGADQVAVVTTTPASGTTPANGIANIGGRVGFAPVAGYTIRYNDLYTILTAQGGVTGTFNAPTALSAILTPQFVYSANAVQARIIAGSYLSVAGGTPVQAAYSRLLDANRATNYNGLSDLYGILDLQNAATIQSTLEGLAPRTETLTYSMAGVATDNLARFYRQRLASLDVHGGLGGTLTLAGNPVQLASLSGTAMPGGQVMSDTGPARVSEGALPDDVSAFVAGGYLEGNSRSMPTAVPFGNRDDFHGWYAAAGIEKEAGDHGVIGLGLSYTNMDGTTGGVAQRANGHLYSGTLYGKLELPSGLTLDGQSSAGAYDARTRRTVGIVGTPFTLRSYDRALALSGEAGLGFGFDLGGIKVGPRVAFRGAMVDFTPTAESGGGPALRFNRQNLYSEQARAGLQLAGGIGGIKPFASAYYVHDFADRPGLFTAGFVGGPGANAAFAFAGDDQDWAEVAAGLAYNAGSFEVSVSADTTIERKDVKNQAYRGSVSFHF